jgi:GT2 family glycosyltransferase
VDVQPQAAPPVVAVVVAKDPGEWFDEVLGALAAQDYPNISVLVIDTGSDEMVAGRVATHLPDAYVRRLDDNPGYGPAANEALNLVEGAGFFCFMHDDVALEPATIRLLVEESYRSNAGILGPKLVEWDDPRRLLAVGVGVDKAGVQVPLVERGELDQEQHDAVRDVFMVPGACMLVRVDLFDALDGFDPEIPAYGEDLDLCWRAHVVGARVMVNPDTRARHRQAIAETQPDEERSRLLARHRLRTVMKSYGLLHLIRVVPQIAVITMATVISSLLTGHPGRARDAIGAWTWNLARLGDIRHRSKYLDRIRLVPDAEVRFLQTRGSAQVRAVLRRRASDERFAAAAAVGRSVADTLAAGPQRTALLAWAAVVAFLIVGGRELITDGVPAIGQLAPLPDSATDLFQTFTSGWRTIGLGTTAAAPTAFAGIAFAGIALFGQMGLLHTLLALLPMLIGLIGMWRLTAPIGSVRPRIASLVVYAAVPLPYNAISNGRWDGLVAYAALPWVLSHLAGASELAPFDARPPRRWWASVIGLGVVIALAMAVVPFVLVLVVMVATSIVLASVLVGGWRGALRAFGVALGAVVVAVVLHLPWSATVLWPGSDWSGFGGVEPAGVGTLSLGEILRFETGSLGAAPLGWAFLVAGALALVLGRGWRLSWATRAWTIAAVPFALVWASSRGWVTVGLPSAEALLAPAAAALALAAGLGIAAFEIDLRGYRFGWRQLASLVAAAAIVVGMVPALIAASGGRWRAPHSDFAASLGFMDQDPEAGAFRVLWLGQPSILPLAGWQLGDGVAYATSDNGPPDVTDLWVGSAPDSTQLIAQSVTLAANGQTDRLGHLLGPMGIRYVVVPDRLAPAIDDTPLVPAPAALTIALASQLDLRHVEVDDALDVYENTAWTPVRSLQPTSPPDAAEGAPPVAPQPVLLDETGVATFTGELAAGTVVVADAATDRWTLRVNDDEVRRETAYGWANSYAVADPGAGSLSFDTPLARTLAVTGQAAVWLLAIVLLLRWKTSIRWPRGARATVPASPAPDASSVASAELETSGAPT